LNEQRQYGPYSLIRKIGQGGMAEVWQGRHVLLDRPVAIKVLLPELANNAELQNRFISEGKSQARLQHPNIVSAFDFFQADGRSYLVMQYVEGVSLETRLNNRNAPLTLEEIHNISRDILSALDYAHSLGIVHRDVKPSNMVTETSGRTLLMDFGIAKAREESSSTLTGVAIGTPSYMSPEQILHPKTVDARSDVYSFGCVLYAMLSGSPPFPLEDTSYEVMSRHVNTAPPPLVYSNPKVPHAVGEVVLKCLEKDPDKRFQSCAAVLRALDAAISDGTQGVSSLAPTAPTYVSPANASPSDASLPVRRPTLYPQESSPSSRASTVIERNPISTGILASDAKAASKEPDPALASDATRFVAPTPPGAEGRRSLPRVRLTFTAGNDGALFGRSVVISSTPFRIGRDADLSINDVHLTRVHAVIDWDGRAFTITDKGSRNGTYVNGRQVRTGPQTLPFGAVIRLGASTVLTFSSDEICEMPDLTGQTIAGRYRLTKVLRSGTKTTLYEANDSHLPQKVAVKILSPNLAEYAGYTEHFNREAEMAVGLRHPHICRVLDYGQATIRIGSDILGTAVNYLSMELMEGGSLADRVAEGTAFELSQVMSWLNDITNALESAHRCGVTHGGLKLSSIMFDREGEPYVTDFAMAHRVDDSVKPVFFGSPEFLAPELWEGVVPTALADQYALAVLTYLLVAGSLPFEGQIDPKVRERNFMRGPVPAHEEAARAARRGVSPRVSEVLKRALSVDPLSRYSSVREFFLALQYSVTATKARSDGQARIFISYQRDSSAGWAVHFASELGRKHQIAAFVDTQRMDSVVRFPARLKKAIEDCDVFVCLVSGNTLQSKWVQEEIRMAWENDKPMVPVFQESYSPPDPSERLEPHIESLINYDGVKLLDRQNLYVENAIEKLAEMVTESVRRAGRNES
jgi:serine/threonine protein kinase